MFPAAIFHTQLPQRGFHLPWGIHNLTSVELPHLKPKATVLHIFKNENSTGFPPAHVSYQQ